MRKLLLLSFIVISVSLKAQKSPDEKLNLAGKELEKTWNYKGYSNSLFLGGLLYSGYLLAAKPKDESHYYVPLIFGAVGVGFLIAGNFHLGKASEIMMSKRLQFSGNTIAYKF